MSTAVSHPRRSTTLSLLRSLHLADLTPENREELLSEALHVLAMRFDACDAFLFGRDDKNTLTVTASLPDTPQTASEALMQTVTESLEPRLVENAMNANDFAGDPAFQTFNMSWAWCGPLLANSQVSGLLYLDSRRARSWTQAELELLDIVAEYLSLAMQNLELQRRLKNDERLLTAGTAALHCSHSLKNLLQLIGGAAEVIDLALKRDEMPRVLRSWAIMQPNLHRLRRLTLDMLYWSKDRPLEPAECDLNAIALSAIESLALQIGQKNIRLRRKLDKSIPLLNLDGGRIHELITNLILNAADVVAENTGLISISTKLDRRSKKVRITISNNGPQMTDEQIAKAFVPFHSTKQRFGTGLGLAIAKCIAEQHHGSITIKTSPRTTSFALVLPAAAAD